MKKFIRHLIYILPIISILYFILLLIMPIGRIFLFSFFWKDDFLFCNYSNISNSYPNLKYIIFIDISYILLKNNIYDKGKFYIDSIDLEKISQKDKAMILNYYGYISFKNNNLEKSKEYLIEACKIDPSNFILISNLNYILSLINKKNPDNNSDKNDKLSDVIELENLNNLQNAENQIIKFKTEKRKESRINRYW
ncbi:MAG: hypothetical protein GYA61_06470 [Spirochaetales bacterium]|nr:hypothetical protein [Spirochaetales bacterium]